MAGDDKIPDAAGTKESTSDALDRARLARERREAEQKKRLDELRAHAAAAQALREKRDEERRQRQAEQRQRDEDRRQQVGERKRAICEETEAYRNALLQREKERNERLERVRAARNVARADFAFGSSTPRLLEPIDSSGCYWATRRSASTTNVMLQSAPLTRRPSSIQLSSEDIRDDTNRQQAALRSSVARRRTDLMPTIVVPRTPGRAYSMTRLDRIPAQRPLHSASPSLHHLNRTHFRMTPSGETSPGSRPGSAMSGSSSGLRRINTIPRKRPVTMYDVPAPSGDTSAADSGVSTLVTRKAEPRRARPVSMYAEKPPNDKNIKPPLPPKPNVSKETNKLAVAVDENQVSAAEVTEKLEALQTQENKENSVDSNVVKESKLDNLGQVTKSLNENEISASMIRRITTEEEAKAALAERRRKAKEELERQAELRQQKMQREAEEEAERQRKEEEEARELAQLQRTIEQEKLKKAIEAYEQMELEVAVRKAREEAERQARQKEEEEKRRAAEEAERLREKEAEREEKERLARKRRVEAIMERTRLKKADEDKTQQQVPTTSLPQTDDGSGNNLTKNEIREPAPANAANNGNLALPLGIMPSNSGNVSGKFIETEIVSEEHTQSKLPDNNVPKLIEDDFTAHNGHGANHNHPLTLQNAI